MVTLITDTELEKELLAQRQAFGSDRYDEVWEGVYIMAPMPNDNHQALVNAFVSIFQFELVWSGKAAVRPGVNVSDRIDDWKKNYRVPDVAVFLKDTSAQNHDTFWFGGPDFAIEIASPEDRTREKIEFYAEVNTRELLIVDRDPWQLELLRLDNNHLRTVEVATAGNGIIITSEIVPFSFELKAGDEGRPLVRVTAAASDQSWEF